MDKTLELIITKSKQLYPKTGRYNDGDFALVSCIVNKSIKGEPHISDWGNIVIVGSMPYMKTNVKYKFIGTEKYDEQRRSYSYEVGYMDELSDKLTDKDFELYLQDVLTPAQFKKIKKIPNLKPMLDNEDISLLVQTKGIGVTTAKQIIKSYNANKECAGYIAQLSVMGVSETMRAKLLEKYHSYEVAINIIRNNPYVLAEDVSGIGFAKADDMAIKAGMPLDDPRRIRGLIYHFLNSKSIEGQSYVYFNDLLNEIVIKIYNSDSNQLDRELLGAVLSKMLEQKSIWASDDRKYIGLYEVYALETQLAKEILRISKQQNKFKYDNWEEEVEAIEREQGWKYTDEQKNGVLTSLRDNFVMVVGKAGCVDADTEFFDGAGWKRIADYKEGDEVLQYHENGKATLTKPKSYIKEPCESMTLITTQRGSVNQCLSDEHTVVYKTSKGNLMKRPFHEVKKIHSSNMIGFRGRFMTTFDYEGSGLDFTDEEIRVLVMTFADGHFPRKNKTCYLKIKKIRKIRRAKQLLDDANIPYSMTVCEDGYRIFKYESPAREKTYMPYWYQCSKKQLQIIADEVLLWDGSTSTGRKSFSTTVKSDADFVQFVFSSLGYRTTILINDRRGRRYKEANYVRKNIEYTTFISRGSKELQICGDARRTYDSKGKMEEYKTTDGYKYCFEVDSGMLVLRRGDRIFITGNSGKTTVTNAMSRILSKNNYVISQACLAGKASMRMQEVTGRPSSTIHRLLEFHPREGFLKNKNNPIFSNVVIIDEVSMVDARLMLSLLRAVTDKTKVIFLGDPAQLPSIGLGNVMTDLLNNRDAVSVVELTQIHRQAQKSAIITQSIAMRENKQIVPYGFQGTAVMGELQDLVLDVGTENLEGKVLKYFQEAYEKYENIMDVTVVCSTRLRGKLSTYNINNIIKNWYNPINKDNPMDQAEYVITPLDSRHSYFISVGDKIIITKNNYKAEVWNYDKGEFEEGAVFNGNLGIITEIGSGFIEMEIETIGRARFKENKYNTIELGYAISCHRSQGSQYKSTVIAMDMGGYTLLSSEWGYTAITRATDKAVVIAEPNALHRCCSNNLNSLKLTFLGMILNRYKIEGEI